MQKMYLESEEGCFVGFLYKDGLILIDCYDLDHALMFSDIFMRRFGCAEEASSHFKQEVLRFRPSDYNRVIDIYTDYVVKEFENDKN